MRTLVGVLVIGGLAVFGLTRWLAAPEIAPSAAPADVGPSGSASGPGAVERLVETDTAPAQAAPTEPAGGRRAEAAPAPARTVGGFEGRVVDERGRALAGVSVELVRPASADGASRSGPPWTATTETDGRFVVTVPARVRRLELRLRARGFLASDRELELPGDEQLTSLGDLTLERGVVIAGIVLDPAGRAAPGAAVHLIRPQGPELPLLGIDVGDLQTRFGGGQTTGADGRFEYPHEEPGDFELRAVHPEYPVAALAGSAEGAGDDQQELVLQLAHGAAIRGVVTGLPDTPAAGAIEVTARAGSSLETVRGALSLNVGDMLEEVGLGAGERRVPLDADGSFVLAGLVPDSAYRIWAIQPGAGPGETKSCSETVDARAGDTGIRLVFDAGQSIGFDVVDARTGSALVELAIDHDWQLDPGWTIHRARSVPVPRTFPDGRVVLDELRPPRGQATLEITVDAVGYERTQRTAEVRRGAAPIELGTIALTPVPLVRVTALESATGRPIPGAYVLLSVDEPPDADQASDGSVTVRRSITFSSGGSASEPETSPANARAYRAVTAADGTCVLSSFPGRIATLRVTSDDWAPWETELELSATDDTDVTARLALGGSVFVSVVDVRDRPLADVDVEHRALGSTRTRTTDASGHVAFSRLTPGAHAFRVAPLANEGGLALRVDTQAADEVWTIVAVEDERRSALTLVEPLRGALTGTVTENGVPLENATVSLVRERAAASADPAAAALEQVLANELGGLMALSGPRTRTDADGRYRLERVAVGRYTLRVEHPRRAMPTTRPVAVAEGERDEDVPLSAAVLRGRVVGADGSPIRRARVSASAAPTEASALAELGRGAEIALVKGLASQLGGGSRTVTTDRDGFFELRGVTPSAPIVVTASASGHVERASEPLQVAGDETRALEPLVLAEAGRIKVEVESVSAAAAPVSASAHWAGDADVGAEPAAAVLNRGRALFRNLHPGPWRVVVGDREELVEVRAGDTAELQLTF